MKIALRDFRAFQETGLIEIRPLTFLVGENSSGKTSLLSALNFVWRLQEKVSSATFNSPPFDLGTFDEIVHRVRGRTKPSSFEICVEETISLSRNDSMFLRLSRHIAQRPPETVRLRLHFVNNVGDAAISSLSLTYAGYVLTVQIRDSFHVKVLSTVGQYVYDSKGGQSELALSRRIGRIDQVSIGELIFYLRRLLIEIDSPENSTPQEGAMALALTAGALESLTRSFPTEIFASAPVRSNPIRVYTPVDQTRTPDGTHTPQRLFKIKESDQNRWERIKTGLENFGQMSGMFTAINVARYRSTGSSPFHINVTRRGKQSNIVDVGYGVSQALPILTDLIESPPRGGFLFQQPEVHLHPQAQAALGSFFVQHVRRNKRSLIVAETHSDYLIDRVRLSIKNGLISATDVSLLYFETEGTSTAVHQLEMNENGDISKAPSGYRSFFINEQMNILGFSE